MLSWPIIKAMTAETVDDSARYLAILPYIKPAAQVSSIKRRAEEL